MLTAYAIFYALLGYGFMRYFEYRKEQAYYKISPEKKERLEINKENLNNSLDEISIIRWTKSELTEIGIDRSWNDFMVQAVVFIFWPFWVLVIIYKRLFGKDD